MILIRYLLIGLDSISDCQIIYQVMESESGLLQDQNGQDKNGKQVTKKVSKEIGEYIDYEEVKKK